MPRDAGERPIGVPDQEHDQADQAELITDTGNEVTASDEEAVLAELYGAPDSDGVYRGVCADDRE